MGITIDHKLSYLGTMLIASLSLTLPSGSRAMSFCNDFLLYFRLTIKMANNKIKMAATVPPTIPAQFFDPLESVLV